MQLPDRLSGCGKGYGKLEIISTDRQNMSTCRDIIGDRTEKTIVIDEVR